MAKDRGMLKALNDCLSIVWDFSMVGSRSDETDAVAHHQGVLNS